MMSNTKLILVTVIFIAVAISGCNPSPENIAPENDEMIGLANPASVFCEEQGGALEIREDVNGTYGVCIFPDGSECEEWAYFRGECQPGGPTEEANQPQDSTSQAIAWYGRVISSGSDLPAESKLRIAPEGTGEVFVTGENGVIENAIISIRDKEPPANYANFWGRLDCPAAEACLLTVTKIRLDGPGQFFEPDIVEAWEGIIITTHNEPGSGGDDCIVISGEFDIQYGISGADEAINQQIEAYKDSGQLVRIWGTLTAGIPDWNGTQIMVSKIEVVE
jgi:putative hemolysin